MSGGEKTQDISVRLWLCNIRPVISFQAPAVDPEILREKDLPQSSEAGSAIIVSERLVPSLLRGRQITALQ
jgi:hypothetical protein